MGPCTQTGIEQGPTGDRKGSSAVQDRGNPQAYAVFHGKATVSEAGADAHIDKLAKRFLGADKYPFRRPGEKRLIVRVKPDRIGGFGPKMQPWS